MRILFIGLDPAGPLFKKDGLDRNDAAHVEVIHTDTILGRYVAIGAVDVFLTWDNNFRLKGGKKISLSYSSCRYSAARDIFMDKLNGTEYKNYEIDPEIGSLGTNHVFILDVSGSMSSYGRNQAMISSLRHAIALIRENRQV